MEIKTSEQNDSNNTKFVGFAVMSGYGNNMKWPRGKKKYI